MVWEYEREGRRIERERERERESKRDKEIGREHKEKTHKYIKGRKGKREWAKDERKINNAKN